MMHGIASSIIDNFYFGVYLYSVQSITAESVQAGLPSEILE